MGKSLSCRNVSFLACLFIVLLRMSIGWQFVYEGLWKQKTLKTDKPWSAEGYLGASSGPLRDTYRKLLDDPDGFQRLDYAEVTKAWDSWAEKFAELYSLDSVQKTHIDAVLNGPKEFRFPLEKLPAGIEFSKVKLPKGATVSYDAEKRELVSNAHLVPSERDALKKLADAPPTPKKVEPAAPPVKTEEPAKKEEKDAKADEKKADEKKSEEKKSEEKKQDDDKSAEKKSEEKPVEAPANDPKLVEKYKAAIDGLFSRAAKLSLKERLRLHLVEAPDPDQKASEKKQPSAAEQAEVDRSQTLLAAEDITIDPQRPSDLTLYKKLVKRYEEALQLERTHFQRQHLQTKWKEILEKRAKLVGPVDALTAELVSTSYNESTPGQLVKVKSPPVPFKAKVAETNQRTIWALLIIGGLMMAGLFTRLASLAGAGLLMLFYLSLPPWPGVPGADEAAGPEHSLIVNKNLIEALACLALTFLPSGRWFGVDGLIHRMLFRNSDR